MTKRLPTKWIPVFTIGVALFFIVMLFLWDFNAYAQKQLETEVQSYAEDIQKQVVITLKKNMEVLQERIETEALIFNMRGEMTDGEIIHELEKFAENEDINRATIITTDGTIYSSELGIEKADPNLFKEALSRTETSINKLRIYEPTGQKFIDISTPVYIDNKNVGFLSVSYDHTNLQRSFKVSFLKGNCSLALITGDGTIIGRVSGRVIPAFRSENLLDFLEQDSVKFTEGSATIFRETLEQEKAAKFEYKEGDKSYFISHEPVGISDWHIATAVADGILQTQAGSLEKMASLLAFKIILLMLACMILFVWYSVGEQNRLKRLKESYRLALKKSNDLFYEIDLIHDSYTDHSEQGKKLFFDLESLKYSDLIGKYSELCGEEDRSKFLNHFLPEIGRAHV